MKNLEKILLPAKLKGKFILEKIEEKETEWIVHIKEKAENIPEKAKQKSFGKKIVKNGYLNPIELVDFPLKGKLCYLKIYRRRWKIEGSDKSYHNNDKLHRKGLKCTIEFGNFLKSLNFYRRHKFFRAWPNIRHIRKEDFSMVSRIKRLFK